MHFFKSKKNNILPLYNKIVLLTRKNFFYKDFKLSDSFSNRIYLIFFHLCFILIALKNKESDKNYQQAIFDFFFRQIELNCRELGYGDTKINNEMKKLVKSFYGILIICKKTKEKSDSFDKNVEKYIIKRMHEEIGREINTIGSKSNYAPMQQLVVQMKDELEKIKEQLKEFES